MSVEPLNFGSLAGDFILAEAAVKGSGSEESTERDLAAIANRLFDGLEPLEELVFARARERIAERHR